MAPLLDHTERGSGYGGLGSKLGRLQKVIHLGRDFELLRDNNGVAGKQRQLFKVAVTVAGLAADDGSVGVDHKDALCICLPGGAAGII